MTKGVDYIGVGVGAVIINAEDKVFLSLRGKKARNERGKWEFPGGSVDFGETLAEALAREIQEEFGMEIEVLKPLTIIDHIISDENQHWIAIPHLCIIKQGTPEILEPEKCDGIGWFSIEEMENMPLTIPARNELPLIKKKLQRKKRG